MAARSSLARHEAVDARASIQEAARVAVADARPSLDEILSVWPREQRDRLVLWVFLGPAKEVSIAARFREHAFDGAPRELFRELRRVGNDVPVVVEMEDGRTLVSPLRAIVGG
jgi:hypothetical protein